MKPGLSFSRLLQAALLVPLLGALFAVPAAAKAETSDNPAYTSLMQNVLINADYWDRKPKMLAAGLGFTNILGVTDADSTDLAVAQAAVQAVSGAWNEGLTCPSTATPPQRAYTSAASPSQILVGYGVSVNEGSGLPVEFSWPVLPKTVNPTDFRVTLSDGSVVTPEAASIMPNLEFNERSTVVLVGAFGTPFPSDQGGIFATKVEVVSDATPMKPVSYTHLTLPTKA